MFESNPFLLALLAGFGVSLMAFVGFGSLLLAKKILSKILAIVVAFAAGGLLGGAFFHLLPESIELGGPTFELTLFGILIFFTLDSLLWIYHCHGGHQLHDASHGIGSCPTPTKPVGLLNLVGDAVHNFTDGILLASAFLVSPALGFATTVAIALHEIPQEVGDFGILIHSGYDRRKALWLNFLVALTILLGVIVTFVAGTRIVGLTAYTIPFAAGGFIYMACTNLLSEVKEEPSLKKRLIQTGALLVGLFLLWALAQSEL